jgi:hypothetical protein
MRRRRQDGPRRADPLAASIISAALSEGRDIGSGLRVVQRERRRRKRREDREDAGHGSTRGSTISGTTTYSGDDDTSEEEEDETAAAEGGGGGGGGPHERRKRHLSKMSSMDPKNAGLGPGLTSARRRPDDDDVGNLPWFAQERYTRSADTDPVDPLELQENLKYFKQLGIRTHISTILGVISAAHSVYYNMAVLPDEMQICQRDNGGEWICEIGTFAQSLVEAAAKQDIHIHTQSKTTLLTKIGAFLTAFNTFIIVTSQFVPWCLSKAALPPPERAGQDRVDERRIDLLSMFGLFLANLGIVGNLAFTAVMHQLFTAIEVTSRDRHMAQGGQGRGLDLREILHVVLGTTIVFILLTGKLLYDIWKAEEKDRHRQQNVAVQVSYGTTY